MAAMHKPSPTTSQTTDPSVSPTVDVSLARLATTHAGASRVFHRHRLDFCCRGQDTLADACTSAGLDAQQLLDEIVHENTLSNARTDWDTLPLADIVRHVEERYHASHRAELPRLLQLAKKVEKVHALHPACPTGLSAYLTGFGETLEQHMLKEEESIFPALASDTNVVDAGPLRTLETEHEDHATGLDRLRAIANDYDAPTEACATWQALYLGLAQLERDLMDHVHLENHVLFPRALGAAGGAA